MRAFKPRRTIFCAHIGFCHCRESEQISTLAEMVKRSLLHYWCSRSTLSKRAAADIRWVVANVGLQAGVRELVRFTVTWQLSIRY